MERLHLGKERLKVPTDFTLPPVSRNVQEDLIPPSHFTSGIHRALQISVKTPPILGLHPVATPVLSGESSPVSPWLVITQAEQNILDLEKEQHRTMMLQENTLKGRVPVDPRCAERSEPRSKWDSEWHLEAEKRKLEAERLKGQVKALREGAERHQEEIMDREGTLCRQSLELEMVRDELSKAKVELGQIAEKLVHSSAENERINSQLERLKSESGEEIARLRKDAARREEEAQTLTLRAAAARSQVEEEAQQKTLQLSEHLEEMQRKQEAELQQVNSAHTAELDAARKAKCELQGRLHSLTSEVLQLKNSLMEVSTERDGLKEHLSQMGRAFETQSATLHGLRNYIGQLAPEKREKEQLNEAVERLNKDKADLQVTNELLTVRLNAVHEILSLQEEKMVKKTSTDPHLKNVPEGLQVMKLWREKVFKLCVQLRSKDIELRGERDEQLSKFRSLEQQLQQERHGATVLRHTLDDRIAELDLERVEKETLKRDLAQTHKENSGLHSRCQKSEAECKVLTEAVHRFRQVFESKVAEVDGAQMRLSAFTQRLTFAKRRVETIQGLLMRREALQKVQQAGKQSEQAADSPTDPQTELSLVCEERDQLTQELKRTPQLIEKALADLKEQYESRWRQQQQELQQSWAEVRHAEAEREKAEQSLQHTRAQLDESKVDVEKLRSELDHREQVLQQRLSETEERCAEKLREMECEVQTARNEHTKAVMTFVRASEKQDRESGGYRSTAPRGTQDKDRQHVDIAEPGLMSASTAVRAAAVTQNSVAPRERRKAPERLSISEQARIQAPAYERLLSLLEEVQALRAEDSSEEV